MKRSIKRFNALWLSCLVSATPSAGVSDFVSEALVGGDYRIEMSVADKEETWPVVIRFTLDDRGRVRRSDILYPADESLGRVAAIVREESLLHLKKKIVEGEEACAPGEYLPTLDPKARYASVVVNRFKEAAFVLEGEIRRPVSKILPQTDTGGKLPNRPSKYGVVRRSRNRRCRGDRKVYRSGTPKRFWEGGRTRS